MDVWLLAVGMVLVGAVAGGGWLLGRAAGRNDRSTPASGAAEAALRAQDVRVVEPAGGPPAALTKDAPAGIDTCARCIAGCEERGGGAACGTVCRMAGECA